MQQEFRHGNLVLLLGGLRLSLRVLRFDERVERPHVGKGLEVRIQGHDGDLHNFVPAGPRAGGFKINGRHQAAVEVDQTGIDDRISHGGSSSPSWQACGVDLRASRPIVRHVVEFGRQTPAIDHLLVMDQGHRVEHDCRQVVFVPLALLVLHYVPLERGHAAGERHPVFPIPLGVLGRAHAEPVALPLLGETARSGRGGACRPPCRGSPCPCRRTAACRCRSCRTCSLSSPIGFMGAASMMSPPYSSAKAASSSGHWSVSTSATNSARNIGA